MFFTIFAEKGFLKTISVAIFEKPVQAAGKSYSGKWLT